MKRIRTILYALKVVPLYRTAAPQSEARLTAEAIFDALRKAALLSICAECGDGDETHPINQEMGECYRHGDWSLSTSRRKVLEIIKAALAAQPGRETKK